MNARSEETDVQVLFEKWQAGDEQAFNRLFEVNMADWLLAARCKLKNAGVEHMARPSDLVQETALRMAPYFRTRRAYFRDALHFKHVFRKQVGHQVAVVYRLAPGRNETQLDCERTGRQDGSSSSQWTPSDHKNDPTQDSVVHHLHEAIPFLPEKEQQALQLHYRDGLTEVEVAAEMGCGERWVRELLTRARTFLKEQLADYRHPPWTVMPKGFNLRELLGGGACGEVWKIWAPNKGDRALKYFLPKRGFALCESGWGLVNGIRHANIINVLRQAFYYKTPIEETKVRQLPPEELYYKTSVEETVEMELVDSTLRDVLNLEGKIELPILLRYMWDAACGIDALTKLAIIHRDIKPDNLGVIDGRVKVLDFGFATSLDSWGSSEGHWRGVAYPCHRGKITFIFPVADTTTGGMTECYAPPEFFKNEIAMTSDEYSLGVSYLEMRTGRLKFRGKKSLRTLSFKDLPLGERRVVARCLDANPAQRWPDCCTFVRELASIYKNKLPADLLDLIASRPEEAQDYRKAYCVSTQNDPIDDSVVRHAVVYGPNVLLLDLSGP